MALTTLPNPSFVSMSAKTNADFECHQAIVVIIIAVPFYIIL
jgi:hypothetical protein